MRLQNNAPFPFMWVSFGNVIAKQGEDFSTLNIPVSNSTFSLVLNKPWQYQPHVFGMHVRYLWYQELTHHRGLADGKTHINWCFNPVCKHCQAACRIECTSSLGKVSSWCQCLRRYQMSFETTWFVLSLQKQWNRNKPAVGKNTFYTSTTVLWGNQSPKWVSIS